jgi:hypothetical protein
MIQDKEIIYQETLASIVSILYELTFIVVNIKEDFVIEQKQDPRLTSEMIDNRLELLRSSVNSFRSYAKRKMSWSLEKYCRYVKDSIQSFHREFDNPFLGSDRWYQRIIHLQDLLTEQAKELDKLIKDDQL